MKEKTIVPGYKHYLSDTAIGSNLAEHVRAADLLMAKPSWLGFWTPSSTVRFFINDVVKTPLTVVKSGVPPQDAPIGVVWRDRDREIEIQLPGNLLQVPFFMGLGSPPQICLIALAHESFHCAQMDRQTRMNVSIDHGGSPFSQAIHPKLPAEALSLCVALFKAYPDGQASSSSAAVKRLGDSALEGQADLAGLMAIRQAYPNDFATIRDRLVIARRNAHAIDPSQYDNADAVEAIGANMPSSLEEVALSTWRWVASEINLNPATRQLLASENSDLPALAQACENSLSKIGGLRINMGKLMSKTARVMGYGKAPT